MANPQLRLVTETPQQPATTDPVRIAFNHWLLMSGRNAKVCKLGQTRTNAIKAAVALYDLDIVLTAIDGMASDPLDDCSPSMAARLREIEWFLATEARIERWFERGQQLHAAADRELQRRAAPPSQEPPSDPEAAQRATEARAKLKQLRLDLAQRMRAGQGPMA